MTNDDHTGNNRGFEDYQAKLFEQGELSSKFFTPDVQRESVNHDLSDQKQLGHIKPKIMSFVGNATDINGINMEG